MSLFLLLPACIFDVGSVGIDESDVDTETCGFDGGGLQSGWSDDLSGEGCAWFVRAVDPDGYRLLTFDIPEFGDAAGGEAVEVTYEVTNPVVHFQVETGCGLDQGVCGTADFSPFTAYTYLPTAGTVDVTVTPAGDEGDATLVFTGVELATSDGELAVLADGYTLTARLGD